MTSSTAPRIVPVSDLTARDQATAADFGFHKHEGAFGWFGVTCPHHPPAGGDTPSPVEAAPALTKHGKLRDTQRSKVYALERNSRQMAGGSPYTRPAHGYGTDRVGVQERSFRFTNPAPMSWQELEALAERVCGRFRVPTIRFLDGGNTRHSAAFRWEPTSKMPHDWPQMVAASGRTYTVCISLPKWARNPWAVLHEMAHYLTYCFYPASTAGHGPEFVAVYFRLLDDFGPADFDRQAAEVEATRRRVKFVAAAELDRHLELSVAAGISHAWDPVLRENRRKAAIEAHYEKKQREREQYAKEWDRDFGHLLTDTEHTEDTTADTDTGPVEVGGYAGTCAVCGSDVFTERHRKRLHCMGGCGQVTYRGGAFRPVWQWHLPEEDHCDPGPDTTTGGCWCRETGTDCCYRCCGCTSTRPCRRRIRREDTDPARSHEAACTGHHPLAIECGPDTIDRYADLGRTAGAAGSPPPGGVDADTRPAGRAAGTGPQGPEEMLQCANRCAEGVCGGFCPPEGFVARPGGADCVHQRRNK